MFQVIHTKTVEDSFSDMRYSRVDDFVNMWKVHFSFLSRFYEWDVLNALDFETQLFDVVFCFKESVVYSTELGAAVDADATWLSHVELDEKQ